MRRVQTMIPGLLLLLPTIGLAAGGGGLYAALGAGNADVDDTIQGATVDDSDTGVQLVLGYNFTGHVALEGGYVDFGDFDARSGALRGTTEVDGVTIGVRAQYELADHFYLQGRAGVFLWDVETNGNVLGTPVRAGRDDGEDLYYGIGGRWDFHKSWGVSLDYARFETDEVDVDLVSGSLYWRFDF